MWRASVKMCEKYSPFHPPPFEMADVATARQQMGVYYVSVGTHL